MKSPVFTTIKDQVIFENIFKNAFPTSLGRPGTFRNLGATIIAAAESIKCSVLKMMESRIMDEQLKWHYEVVYMFLFLCSFLVT